MYFLSPKSCQIIVQCRPSTGSNTHGPWVRWLAKPVPSYPRWRATPPSSPSWPSPWSATWPSATRSTSTPWLGSQGLSRSGKEYLLAISALVLNTTSKCCLSDHSPGLAGLLPLCLAVRLLHEVELHPPTPQQQQNGGHPWRLCLLRSPWREYLSTGKKTSILTIGKDKTW